VGYEEVAIQSNLQVKLNISGTCNGHVLSGDMLPPYKEQKMWIQFKICIHTQIKKGTTITLMIENNSLRARLSKLTAVLNEGPGMLCQHGIIFQKTCTFKNKNSVHLHSWYPSPVKLSFNTTSLLITEGTNWSWAVRVTQYVCLI
jgi:hypothetical protein